MEKGEGTGGGKLLKKPKKQKTQGSPVWFPTIWLLLIVSQQYYLDMFLWPLSRRSRGLMTLEFSVGSLSPSPFFLPAGFIGAGVFFHQEADNIWLSLFLCLMLADVEAYYTRSVNWLSLATCWYSDFICLHWWASILLYSKTSLC